MGRRGGVARSRLGPRTGRGALGLTILLVATGLRVGAEVSPGWAGTDGAVTLTPVADATVAAEASTTNFGGADRLDVDQKPRSEAYVRFTVPAAGRATLRLWVLDSTKDGPRIRRYNGTLNETAVTWNNRVTPLVGTAVDAPGALTAGSWAEWDVTGLLSGPGDVTLAVVADSEDGTEFASRESVHRPQLVIAPPAVQTTFAAVADARVEEEKPATNFGAIAGLAVDNGDDDDIHSYIRFAVTGLVGAVSRATLRLYVTDGTVNGPSIFATADGWSETGLTWATKPDSVGPLLANLGPVRAGWVSVDVTRAVAGNGTVNLVVLGGDTDGLWFRAREGAEGERPHLVVEASTAPTTTSTSTTSSSTSTSTSTSTTSSTTSTSTSTTSSTTSTSSSTTTTNPGIAPRCGPNWDPAGAITKLPSGLSETSGFVASPVYRSWGWGIRDSGNPASLYAIRPGDSTPKVIELRAYDLKNSDWEDVAYTPGFAPGSGHLWVLENVGNSWMGNRRIYQFEEVDPNGLPPWVPPTTTTTSTTTTSTTTTTVPSGGDPGDPGNPGTTTSSSSTTSSSVPTTTTVPPPPPPPPPPPATLVGAYQWAYPDVQANTETMFVFDGDLVVVTKTTPSRVYRFNGPLLPFTVNVPTYVGTLPAGNVLSIAALSVDQRTLAFSNHGRVDIYENRGDVHDLAALISNPVFSQKMAADNREGGSFFPYGSCDIVLMAESKNVWRLPHR